MSDTGDNPLELIFAPDWAKQPAGTAVRSSVGGGGRRHESAPAKQRRPLTIRKERRPAPDGARRRERPPEPVPPPVAVSFIPERNSLEKLVKLLTRAARAFPLFEVANLFLSRPEFYAVRLEARNETAADGSLELHQCAECKTIFLERTQALQHALLQHGALFYAREEVQREAPKGAFQCVVRCTLSDELLGPPNYHAFNERLLELHATRFASMSLDAYRQKLVNESDPALIEKWKEQATAQITYRTLKAEPSQTFTRRSEMEAHFTEHYAPMLIRSGLNFVALGTVCQSLEDEVLRRLIAAARAYESRFPLRLALSLQRHLLRAGLHSFKHSGRTTFITGVKPNPIAPERTDAAIRRILETIAAQPEITRKDLLAQLYPDPPDEAAQTSLQQALRWLADRGHIIEFSNGNLMVPRPAARPRKTTTSNTELSDTAH